MLQDTLSRTTKLEMDEGTASSLAEALLMEERRKLQVEVGDDVAGNEVSEATLLTIVNSARRCFGSVRVRIQNDEQMSTRWSLGETLSASIANLGGTLVRELTEDFPTIVVGTRQSNTRGSVVLQTTWAGWSGGIVRDDSDRLTEDDHLPLTGVLVGGLAVSEAFQYTRKKGIAGYRTLGMSLWDPRLDWRSKEALGMVRELPLPSRLWLLGLGHLGQAYAWSIGFLPYPDTTEVELMLQDYDSVKEANYSTGMLLGKSDIRLKKSRVIAARIEQLGFKTFLTERKFDWNTLVSANEPKLALGGLDNIDARRCLENAGFQRIIDGGLGGQSHNYATLTLHVFPSGLSAATAWSDAPDESQSILQNQPAYRDLAQRDNNQCGVIEVAGRSVAAAFVGSVASSLVIAEAIRSFLAEAPRFQFLRSDTRGNNCIAVPSAIESKPINTGFVLTTRR